MSSDESGRNSPITSLPRAVSCRDDAVLHPNVQQSGSLDWSFAGAVPWPSTLVMQSGLPKASCVGIAAIAPVAHAPRKACSTSTQAAINATTHPRLCRARCKFKAYPRNFDSTVTMWRKRKISAAKPHRRESGVAAPSSVVTRVAP